jgi:hypothetical protein
MALGLEMALLRRKRLVRFSAQELTLVFRPERERLTLCGHLQPNDGSTVDLTAQSAPSAMTLNSTRCAAPA